MGADAEAAGNGRDKQELEAKEISLSDSEAYDGSNDAGLAQEEQQKRSANCDTFDGPDQQQRKQEQREGLAKIEVGPEYVMQADVTSSCITQTLVAGVGGMGLGALAGLALGSAEGVETGMQHQSTRSAAKTALKEAGSRCWAYAKGFGGVGALYR